MIPGRSVLVAIGVSLFPAAAAAQSTSSADADFRAFLYSFEAAINSMVNGDGAAWKALLSAEPVGTLFTPFGGVVQGAPALTQQYDSLAKSFAQGYVRVKVEYLSIEVSGDLASVVALERSTFRRIGSDSTQAGFTRATMIFRREVGGWKLRHRHMDHLREGPGRK